MNTQHRVPSKAQPSSEGKLGKILMSVAEHGFQIGNQGFDSNNNLSVDEAKAAIQALYISRQEAAAERERACNETRVEENKYWCAVLLPSGDRNVAYIEDFDQRINVLQLEPNQPQKEKL